MCILLGCDYCESIRGIGPKRAIELIKKHKTIDAIVENLDSKFTAPEGWIYKEARQLFLSPEVADPQNIEVRSKYILCYIISCRYEIIFSLVDKVLNHNIHNNHNHTLKVYVVFTKY